MGHLGCWTAGRQVIWSKVPGQLQHLQVQTSISWIVLQQLSASNTCTETSFPVNYIFTLVHYRSLLSAVGQDDQE